MKDKGVHVQPPLLLRRRDPGSPDSVQIVQAIGSAQNGQIHAGVLLKPVQTVLSVHAYRSIIYYCPACTDSTENN